MLSSAARETHGPGATAFQESYTYSGGLGQVVLQKTKAEPGLAPNSDGNGTLVFLNGELVFEDTGLNTRWVGSGRTIVDNKGNPVKQYEPFFDTSPACGAQCAPLLCQLRRHAGRRGGRTRRGNPKQTHASKSGRHSPLRS